MEPSSLGGDVLSVDSIRFVLRHIQSYETLGGLELAKTTIVTRELSRTTELQDIPSHRGLALGFIIERMIVTNAGSDKRDRRTVGWLVLERLYVAGMTLKQVARELNVSPREISRLRDEGATLLARDLYVALREGDGSDR